MQPDRWREVEKLYHAACERKPEERLGFLESATEDKELAKEVASLLAHEPGAAQFLDSHGGQTGELSQMRLPAGERIGPYVVLEFIGAGGMGEVYKVRDTRLDRLVAMKLLPKSSSVNPEALERFQREARAASALNHPRICTIHDSGQYYSQPFFVMELLQGQSLRERISDGQIPLPELLSIIMQVADALNAAHAAGIVHRDIKPANIFLTGNAQIKILDFGLAKFRTDPVTSAAQPVSSTENLTVTVLTRPGQIAGTIAYSSPEQARGQQVDTRSDIFSLGVVLYEMATGSRPFRGDTWPEVIASVLTTSPTKPSVIAPGVDRDLERIILKALNKNPAERHQSAQEVMNDLEGILTRARRRRWYSRVGIAAVVVLGLAGVGTWYGVQFSRTRWARNEAVPRARLLAESGNAAGALDLLRQAEHWLPHDPEIENIRRVYAVRTTIQTSPPGASLYFKDYMDLNAPWKYLGKSPLDMFIAVGQGYRVKLEKPGFRTLEAAWPFGPSWSATLAPQTGSPAEMVWGSGGPVQELHGVVLPDYWLDKYEVTNRQYKQFVDADGYQSRRFWKQDFIKDGRRLSFEQAMAEFKDATGRSGPSSWQFGTYPAGQDDFPVGGVSWYEAAAYAEFAGKSLPTVHHWRRASNAASSFDAFMQKVSNFDGKGPAKVGSYPGVSPVGAYDLTGNVREWSWNSVGDRRYILGGDWNDSGDSCMNPENRSPFDRAQVNGFRCMRSTAPVPEAALAPVELAPKDRTRVPPVSDAVFRAYRAMFSYDRTELQPTIEHVEEAALWRKEKVSFAAAYGNERVTAYLFLPKNARPPYQTVVYCPSLLAFYMPDSQRYMELPSISYLMLSGRAVMYPVYKGTFERGNGTGFEPGGSAERDLVVQWRKDLGRAIDYLETRRDIDPARLGFYAVSTGAWWGPVLTQVEERFKASVLLGGGLSQQFPLPEVDAVNYLPRNHLPTLLISGRDDYIVPVETHQKPMFRLLGTPERDKRYVLLNCGHNLTPLSDVVKEVVPWLDRYLGPVQTINNTPAAIQTQRPLSN